MHRLSGSINFTESWLLMFQLWYEMVKQWVILRAAVPTPQHHSTTAVELESCCWTVNNTSKNSKYWAEMWRVKKTLNKGCESSTQYNDEDCVADVINNINHHITLPTMLSSHIHQQNHGVQQFLIRSSSILSNTTLPIQWRHSRGTHQERLWFSVHQRHTAACCIRGCLGSGDRNTKVDVRTLWSIPGWDEQKHCRWNNTRTKVSRSDRQKPFSLNESDAAAPLILLCWMLNIDTFGCIRIVSGNDEDKIKNVQIRIN